ncbi:site-specific integrase [Roseovarius mucosus]|uniref:site-specific integrase n=1 Tax=Roseovarius mucosus TaxID=215743 RepID=UPI0035CF02C5
MAHKLDKVFGTQQRGQTYHFNLPIPPVIRDLYDNKAAYRGTMKTSDPKEAEKKVRRQRTIFDEQVERRKRDADMKRLAELLTEDQRAALAAIGGAGQITAHVEGLRRAAAFLTAGIGATDAAPDEELGAAAELEQRAQEAAGRAYRDSYVAEIRGAKRIAGSLNVELPDEIPGVDEGVIGLRDVADKFLNSKDYTAHNREKVLYTLRRWSEFHGDLPIEQIERAHIHQFDEALKQLPPAMGDHRKLSIHDSIKRGKKEGKQPVGVKTRETYLLHLKALTAYAVDTLGAIKADPFAGYTTAKPKLRASERKTTKRKPYAPEQVRKIIDYSRTAFDRATVDYWLPFLAAYTGARLEELGQLTVDDITLIGNMHCIRITDLDPTQKVKNYHSLRTLPIPSVISNAGFLDYVEERRKAGGRMLFQESYSDKRKRACLQEVRADKRGRFMTTYGQRFARKVREPLDLTGGGMTFHSLRHSWSDAARRAKIDPEIRRMIAGRLEDADPTEAAYGGDDLLADKLAALEAVAKFVAE